MRRDGVLELPLGPQLSKLLIPRGLEAALRRSQLRSLQHRQPLLLCGGNNGKGILPHILRKLVKHTVAWRQCEVALSEGFRWKQGIGIFSQALPAKIGYRMSRAV